MDAIKRHKLMALLTARCRRQTAIGLALTASLVLAGCYSGNLQPVINSAMLLGTWLGPNGASARFLADQTVIVRQIYLGPANPGICSRVSATGSWQFDSPAGDSGSSVNRYLKGSIIEIDFPVSEPIVACGAQFTTWDVNPPFKLCLYNDPDTPCGSSYVLTREHERKGLGVALIIPNLDQPLAHARWAR